MKRSATILLLLCSILLSGCVSQDEYDSLAADLQDSQNKISELEKSIGEKDSEINSLKTEKEKLESDKASLEEKVDEYENGPARMLSDINNAYEKENYNEAIKLADELHTKYNGSDEDIKAQTVAKNAHAALDKAEAERKAEEERKAAEAAKSAEEKVHELIRVRNVYCSDPNSAGGVDVHIAWENTSQKTIKYAYFYVTPYNAVDDAVSSEIGNKSQAGLRDTGPFEPGYSNTTYYEGYYSATYQSDPGWFTRVYWDCVWYNNTIKYVKLDKIELEYTDGTTATISEDEIQYAIY